MQEADDVLAIAGVNTDDEAKLLFAKQTERRRSGACARNCSCSCAKNIRLSCVFFQTLTTLRAFLIMSRRSIWFSAVKGMFYARANLDS